MKETDSKPPTNFLIPFLIHCQKMEKIKIYNWKRHPVSSPPPPPALLPLLPSLTRLDAWRQASGAGRQSGGSQLSVGKHKQAAAAAAHVSDLKRRAGERRIRW